MDIEAKKQDSQNQQEIEYRERPASPQPLDLGNCLEKLDDYGGMRFIKSLIREPCMTFFFLTLCIKISEEN